MLWMVLAAAAMAADGAPVDRTRLQQLFTHWYRPVWRLLRRLGLPPHAADDVVQQAFMITAERLVDIHAGAERAFLFSTAIRVAQGQRRRQLREQPSDLSDQSSSPLPRPDELADQKRARELLDRVLDQMPMELKTVFILFELEGLTTPAIAEIAGIPLGTAASRLRRARETFHGLVQAHDRATRGMP